jgi:hypothetical protein
LNLFGRVRVSLEKEGEKGKDKEENTQKGTSITSPPL